MFFSHTRYYTWRPKRRFLGPAISNPDFFLPAFFAPATKVNHSALWFWSSARRCQPHPRRLNAAVASPSTAHGHSRQTRRCPWWSPLNIVSAAQKHTIFFLHCEHSTKADDFFSSLWAQHKNIRFFLLKTHQNPSKPFNKSPQNTYPVHSLPPQSPTGNRSYMQCHFRCMSRRSDRAAVWSMHCPPVHNLFLKWTKDDGKRRKKLENFINKFLTNQRDIRSVGSFQKAFLERALCAYKNRQRRFQVSF